MWSVQPLGVSNNWVSVGKGRHPVLYHVATSTTLSKYIFTGSSFNRSTYLNSSFWFPSFQCWNMWILGILVQLVHLFLEK